MKRPSLNTGGPLLLIYDGHCEFCKAWLAWLQEELVIDTVSYHGADLVRLELTTEECSKSVILLVNRTKLTGSDAIAYLLQLRGNCFTATVIRSLGPISRWGYRWVASHRNSWLITTWTKFLHERGEGSASA